MAQPARLLLQVDMAALGTLHSLRELRLEKCDLRVDERCTSAVLARLSELRELCLGWVSLGPMSGLSAADVLRHADAPAAVVHRHR